MRLYTGRPKVRLAIVHERYVQKAFGEPYRMALPEQYNFEITRMWGISIGGWFIGLQRFVRQP